MESTNQRLIFLEAALQRLGESLNLMPDHPEAHLYEQIRDSVIQRFEFSVDLLWKCLKDYLDQHYGVVVTSPKTVFREAFTQKMVNAQEYDALVKMVDDRNDTSHKYDAAMAEEIARRVFAHHDAMIKLFKRLMV